MTPLSGFFNVLVHSAQMLCCGKPEGEKGAATGARFPAPRATCEEAVVTVKAPVFSGGARAGRCPSRERHLSSASTSEIICQGAKASLAELPVKKAAAEEEPAWEMPHRELSIKCSSGDGVSITQERSFDPPDQPGSSSSAMHSLEQPLLQEQIIDDEAFKKSVGCKHLQDLLENKGLMRYAGALLAYTLEDVCAMDEDSLIDLCVEAGLMGDDRRRFMRVVAHEGKASEQCSTEFLHSRTASKTWSNRLCSAAVPFVPQIAASVQHEHSCQYIMLMPTFAFIGARSPQEEEDQRQQQSQWLQEQRQQQQQRRGLQTQKPQRSRRKQPALPGPLSTSTQPPTAVVGSSATDAHLEKDIPQWLELHAAPVESRLLFVVEEIRAAMQKLRKVVCAEAVHGEKCWLLTAYVQPVALKATRRHFEKQAKELVLDATARSGRVFAIGYMGSPFVPMPLGFGATLTEMPDASTACLHTYQYGICDDPGRCDKRHPSIRVGVHVMLKPARHQPFAGDRAHRARTSTEEQFHPTSDL